MSARVEYVDGDADDDSSRYPLLFTLIWKIRPASLAEGDLILALCQNGLTLIMSKDPAQLKSSLHLYASLIALPASNIVDN